MYDDLSTALLAGPLAQYVQRLAHLGDDLLDYIGAVAMCAHPFYRSRTRARRQRVARVFYLTNCATIELVARFAAATNVTRKEPPMSRIPPILILACLLILAAVSAAIGQAGVLAGLVQPFVVDIEQQVPVEVTLALPMDDGAVITATAPITVGVSLQVKIDGAQVVAVAIGDTEPAVATVEESAPAGAANANEGVDAEGRAYTLEPGEGIEIAGVSSSVNSMDGIELVGEITNIGEEDLKAVEIVVTFYGEDDSIVLVENTYAKLDTLAPGQSSPFKVMTIGGTVPIVRYRVQAQP